MKRFIGWQWLVCAVLVWGIAVCGWAQDTQSSAEQEAFNKFMATLVPQASPDEDTPRDEQIKWAKGFFGGVLKAGDEYLKAHPKGENANAVRLVQAQVIMRLISIEDDAGLRARAQSTLQEVLEAKPEQRMAFEAHAWLLRLAKTPEDAARRVEIINREFPDHPLLAQIVFYLANFHQQSGDAENAQKTAKMIVEKYPDSEVADEARAMLKKLSIVGAPIELKFTALDGKSVDLGNYRGKVVLVDFWATWCKPCIDELPNVMKTYADYHAKGFEIIGISLDRNKDKLVEFVAREKMPWPQYFDGKGWDNAISTKFGIQAIPATFLVNKEGKVVRTDLRGEALGKAVGELLNAK